MMNAQTLDELRRRRRAQTTRLMEAADLTRQIAEAAERGDMVAAQMLLGEREQPVHAAYEMEERLREYLQTIPEEDAIRASALIDGAEAASPEEQPLVEQAAQYRRLLESIIEADRRLSTRLGGKESFYNKFGS